MFTLSANQRTIYFISFVLAASHCVTCSLQLFLRLQSYLLGLNCFWVIHEQLLAVDIVSANTVCRTMPTSLLGARLGIPRNLINKKFNIVFVRLLRILNSGSFFRLETMVFPKSSGLVLIHLLLGKRG